MLTVTLSLCRLCKELADSHSEGLDKGPYPNLTKGSKEIGPNLAAPQEPRIKLNQNTDEFQLLLENN